MISEQTAQVPNWVLSGSLCSCLDSTRETPEQLIDRVAKWMSA